VYYYGDGMLSKWNETIHLGNHCRFWKNLRSPQTIWSTPHTLEKHKLEPCMHSHIAMFSFWIHIREPHKFWCNIMICYTFVPNEHQRATGTSARFGVSIESISKSVAQTSNIILYTEFCRKRERMEKQAHARTHARQLAYICRGSGNAQYTVTL